MRNDVGPEANFASSEYFEANFRFKALKRILTSSKCFQANFPSSEYFEENFCFKQIF
jgi:hypothetical protein